MMLAGDRSSKAVGAGRLPRPGIEPGLEVPETSVMSFSLPGRRQNQESIARGRDEQATAKYGRAIRGTTHVRREVARRDGAPLRDEYRVAPAPSPDGCVCWSREFAHPRCP